ncbi:hypothetical protein [Arenibaculum pallidiluteum]|uniref:hypothetical protein n=1 Tax=Arenibaculum pallidiluteum TaxID=2812559 RepID=UPI001A968C43|nr:hypothetical protein [Arenibaculum pallidiluteum]
MSDGEAYPIRSPSGLFTRAAWEREVQASHGTMPRWWRSAELRERQFLAWVVAEAVGLMTQLGRLDTARAPVLGSSVEEIRNALAEDAAWARAAEEALQAGPGPAPSVRRSARAAGRFAA